MCIRDSQAAAQVSQHQIHNAANLILGQALVVDNIVQTVQELRAELALEQQVDLVTRFGGQFVLAVGTVLFQVFQNDVRAKVGGQDDDGVLKVHGTACLLYTSRCV